MELFIIAFVLFTIYALVTTIQVWCIAAFLWVCFDKAFFEKYEQKYIELELKKRRANMKVIQGGLSVLEDSEENS